MFYKPDFYTVPIDEIQLVEIELGTKCQLKCPMCFRNFDLDRQPFQPVKNIINLLAQFKNLKYISIAGERSEPSFYPDLFELLDYLNLRKINIEFYSNAEAKSKNFYISTAFKLSKNPENTFIFTVCGSTQQLHEKYRVGSKLSNILNVYDSIQKICKCKIQYIIFDYNFEDAKMCLKSKAFGTRNMQYINSLNLDSELSLDTKIHPIPEVVEAFKKFDLTCDGRCSSNILKAAIIDNSLNIYPCSAYKYFGKSKCYLCNKNNDALIESYKLHCLPEFQDPRQCNLGLGIADNMNQLYDPDSNI